MTHKPAHILALACLLLGGCASTMRAPFERPIPRVPPSGAMQACKPLSAFEGKTAAELAEKTGAWFREHNVECALPHKQLIDWVNAGQTPAK